MCYKGKLFPIVACYYKELDVLPSSHYTTHGMSVVLLSGKYKLGYIFQEAYTKSPPIPNLEYGYSGLHLGRGGGGKGVTPPLSLVNTA